jgi:serine/threonine protein kinase
VSDWWSVGMLLVELLTGRHPFARADSKVLITSGQIPKRLENQDVEELVAGVPEPYLLPCRATPADESS